MTTDPPAPGAIDRARRAAVGCVLGTAVGDAYGLPFEGLSRRRVGRWLRPGRYRMLFGRGMLSDDTEHTVMVVQSLIESGDDLERYRRALARRMRLWILALPAGVGLATGRALLRLLVGFPPQRSGVFSAGNGPAMRVAPLGVMFGDRPDLLQAFTRATTVITHTDPRAYHGALAVAVAAHLAATSRRVEPDLYQDLLARMLAGEGAEELLAGTARAVASVGRGETTRDFAAGIGQEKGVGGYMLHTVPVVVHGWLSHPDDFDAALNEVVACGGDTDTTAAILGGILGAGRGDEGIGGAWKAGLLDVPRSAAWLTALAEAWAAVMAGGAPRPAPRLNPAAIVARNALFLPLVLAHGLRRLLPPY